MSTKNPETLGRRYAEYIQALDMSDEPHLNPWKNDRKDSWNAAARADAWQIGFKTGVEHNLVADVASRKDSEAAELAKQPFYHVTSPENARNIQAVSYTHLTLPTTPYV